MKNYIILIIKGFFIGLGKIIPGVSGAVIAMILGVYEESLTAITSFFSNKKNNIYILSALTIGIVIAITLFSNVIKLLLYKYYFLTMMFFIGIFISSIFTIRKKIPKLKKTYIILSSIIIIVLSLPFQENSYIIQKNSLDILIFFMGGVLEAVGTVIPGLSSTALLMLIGIYDKVLTIFSNIYNPFYIVANITIILSFSAGLFLGLIIFIKLITYLFSHHKENLLNIILGICISQVLILLFHIIKNSTFSPFGIFTISLGLLVGALFDN